MNKKQLPITVALIIASICSLAFGVQYIPDLPEQAGSPVLCNRGFLTIATPTYTLDDVTPVNIQYFLSSAKSENLLSAKVTGFEIRAASGSFVVCDSTNIATGTDRIGRLVSEDDSYTWNGLAGTFEGKIVANDTSCDIVFDGVWGW